MTHAEIPFEKRLKRILRRHGKMRYGVAHVMTRDGLIVARPRRRLPRFPIQGILILLAASFAFKGFMYFSLGGVDYAARVATLGEGSVVERAGAWLLQADPVTMWVAEMIRIVIGMI